MAKDQDLRLEIKLLESQIERLKEELAEAETEIGDLETRKDAGDLEEKINTVLDLVERPVGTLRARLPQSRDSERALMALYDAIGRAI